LATVLCAGAGFVAASCSSSPSPKQSADKPTTSVVSKTTTTTPSSSSSTSSSTSTSVAGCSGVTATSGQGQGAAGTITGAITLSSASATCTLEGYPTMALFYAAGTTIPVTIVNGLSVDISAAANGSPQTVTLSPSQQVQFTYQYSDVPSGSETTCPSSSTVSVMLPGSSTSTQPITLSLAPCDNGTIRVSPLYAASAG
jgi:hypothetical protein